MTDRNQQIIDEFRANDGVVGGVFTGRPHHTGAKTGTRRVNPLAYRRLSPDAVAVFGSNSGRHSNPDWYHNVIANPEVSVEVGTDCYEARARLAEGEERERIWEEQKRVNSNFAGYEGKTGGREIPVVVIEKTG